MVAALPPAIEAVQLTVQPVPVMAEFTGAVGAAGQVVALLVKGLVVR